MIVALKSRTAPAAEAVAESAAQPRTLSAGWRRRHIYQKYCSTFDSTDAGQHRPGRRRAARPGSGRAPHPSERPPRLPSGGPCTAGTSSSATGCCRSHRSRTIRSPRCAIPISCGCSAGRPPLPVASVDIEDVRAGGRRDRRPRSPELRCRRGAAHPRRRRRGRRPRRARGSPSTDSTRDRARRCRGPRGGARARGAARTGRVQPLHPPPAGGRLILSGSGSARTRAQVAAFGQPAFRLDVDADWPPTSTTCVDACAGSASPTRTFRS